MRETLQTLLQKVRDEQSDAVKVFIEYAGSGDSGEVDNAYATGENCVMDLSDELSEDFAEFGYQLLEEFHGGWEINEGSQGNFEIDMETGKITSNHTTFVESTESEELEL